VSLAWRQVPTWAFSLLLILALHLGLGYWAWFWRAPLPPMEMPPAAIMVELAPQPVVAPPPPPQPVVRAPEPKLVEAPKPKLAIYKPKPKPQPPRVQPKPQPPVVTPPVAQQRPASAPKAAQAAPPSPPSKAVPTWQSELFSHLSRYKRYPEAAKRREREGVRICKLRFTVDAQGRVLEYAVVGPSGNRLLDRATQELIRRAQPLPPPPSELLSNGRLEIVAPIVYELKRG